LQLVQKSCIATKLFSQGLGFITSEYTVLHSMKNFINKYPEVLKLNKVDPDTEKPFVSAEREYQ
jgi:hypothetical protein